MTTAPTTLRLLLWPSLITLAISLLRLLGEVQGWVNAQSGGAGHLLGISWCMFVFGGWFATRLARTGSLPRRRPAWPWGIALLLLQLGAFAWAIRGIDPAMPATPEAQAAAAEVLRASLVQLAICTSVLAVFAFTIWPRLCWTLLLYGLGARLTVVALTWWAKSAGWNTHYTKFGPQGFERDLPATLAGASLAQLGMWVPLTVVFGCVVGTLFAGRRAA